MMKTKRAMRIRILFGLSFSSLVHCACCWSFPRIPGKERVVQLQRTYSYTAAAYAGATSFSNTHTQLLATSKHGYETITNDNGSGSKSESDNGDYDDESSPLVFIFNGQGSQWKGMGKDLIETNSAFRSTMERLQERTSVPLVNLYRDGSKWFSREYSSIGIVSFQLGLLAILDKRGVRSPDLFLGHSVGELVCSYIADFTSEEDVLRLAAIRSDLTKTIDSNMRLDLYDDEPIEGYDYTMSKLPVGGSSCRRDDHDDANANLTPSSSLSPPSPPPSSKIYVRKRHTNSDKDPSVIQSYSMHGQMVVVGCSAVEIESIISKLGLQETRVACYNAPLGQTVSGASVEIDLLVDYITKRSERKIFCHQLDTDEVAYHGTFLEVFREFYRGEFEKVMRMMDMKMKTRTKTTTTTTTKKNQSMALALPPEWISTSRNRFYDVEYIVDNMLRPVYFQEAIESLPSGSSVVEIGPSPILLSQVKRVRSDLHLMSAFDRKDPRSLDATLHHLVDKWPQYGMKPERSLDFIPSI